MISFTRNIREITELGVALNGSANKIRKQLAIAVNKAAKKTLAQLAKEDAKELAAPQKVIKETMKVARKASAVGGASALIVQKKTGRISLRDFKARQTRAGTTYRTSKTGGRKTALGAFQGPKPGVIKASWRGHVFKRKSKERLPIIKLFGPSPWGVTVKNKLTRPVIKFARAQLKKEIQERTRFLNLKKSGAI